MQQHILELFFHIYRDGRRGHGIRYQKSRERETVVREAAGELLAFHVFLSHFLLPQRESFSHRRQQSSSLLVLFFF